MSARNKGTSVCLLVYAMILKGKAPTSRLSPFFKDFTALCAVGQFGDKCSYGIL